MKRRDAKYLSTYDFPERSAVDRRPRRGRGPRFISPSSLSLPRLSAAPARLVSPRLASPRLAAKRRGRNLNFTN